MTQHSHRAPGHIRLIRGAAVTAVLTLATSVLAAAPADAAPQSYHITLEMSECGLMAQGVSGTCISSLQTWLNIFDQTGLQVDGEFGPATEAAVIAFQARHGLVPDGRFGDHSRNALRGVYTDMMNNSVPTPHPAARIRCSAERTGGKCDLGEVQPGLGGGIITSLVCAGFGEAAEGPYGVAAGIGCEILTS